MGKRSKKETAGLGLVFGILGALFAWSFYNILNQGIADLLAYFGIDNFYLQNAIILVAIGLILWFGGKKVLTRLAR